MTAPIAPELVERARNLVTKWQNEDLMPEFDHGDMADDVAALAQQVADEAWNAALDAMVRFENPRAPWNRRRKP